MLFHHRCLRVFLLVSTAAFVVVTVQAQDLIPLTLLGAEGTLTEADLPLSKCQGDCNRNADCDGNLLCFSRGGATTIPGCSGRAESDGTDYCWDPTDKPVEGIIAHVGNNGNPAVLYPLGRCHGQCSSDADCATGLVCLVRDKVDDPVYGCDGPLLDRTDYCVNPGDIPGSTVGTPTVKDTTTTTTTNTTMDGGLSVDGADDTTTDVEPLMGLLTIMYLGGAADPNATEPLGECEGNCGLDVGCAVDLMCFNRTNETVPGCGGILLPNIHYCVKDVTAAPLNLELNHTSLKGKLAIAIYDGAPYESLPLQHCQGDCKSHDMCDQSSEPSACFKRTSNEDAVPGCSGIALNDISYCVKAADLVKEVDDVKENDKSGSAPLWTVLGAILPALALWYCVE